MSEERTLYQWRLELPENVRKRYTKNLLNSSWSVTPSENADNLKKAVEISFDWADSPEGHEFWDKIWVLASRGEITPQSKIEIIPDHE